MVVDKDKETWLYFVIRHKYMIYIRLLHLTSMSLSGIRAPEPAFFISGSGLRSESLPSCLIYFTNSKSNFKTMIAIAVSISCLAKNRPGQIELPPPNGKSVPGFEIVDDSDFSWPLLLFS